MKNDIKKSRKKVTLDENRLNEEKKFHPGSGKNNTCTYDDIAMIMGYENGKTINNNKFTFPLTRVNKLCAAWNVRIEYLQGLDDWRTTEDFEHFLDVKLATDIKSEHDFFDSLGINFDFVFLALCPKDKWIDSFSDYFYFWDEVTEMYYIKMTSTEMIEIFDNDYLLDIVLFYLIKDSDDKIVKIINQSTWRTIINLIKENTIKQFYDFLGFTTSSFDCDNFKIDE